MDEDSYRATGTPYPAAPHTGVAGAISLIAIIIANFLALASVRAPFIEPAIGFWFLFLFPAYLLYTTSIWRGSQAVERVGYSVTAILFLLMVGGLAFNTVLPKLGVSRPLDTVPVVILGDLVNAGLYALRRRRPANVHWRRILQRLGPGRVRLLGLSVLCPLLAVLGANRLNNGAGDQLSLAALLAAVIVLFFLLRWQQHLGDGFSCAVLYPVSVALLLMTSLRGWSVTGHDIQTEYRVFQLTKARGFWDISAIHSAYNACLSLTILPTELSRVVKVDDPYIYKVFFQLLFAVCPLLVYTICRRYGPKYICLLAAIYFIGFPTFLNDMPFINRQEIAFLFVCVGLLAISNSRWPQGFRRVVFLAAALGVELSHYSTMYLFLGMLVVAWLLTAIIRLRYRLSPKAAPEDTPWPTASPTVGIGSVLLVAAMVAIWGGLATQTSGPLLSQVVTAIAQLGHSNNATTYGVFSRHALTPQQVLDEYRTATISQNADTPGSLYLPTSAVEHYPTPLVSEPSLPLTSIGRLLRDLKVPVGTLNTDVRQGAAKDEQLFVVVGFAAVLLPRRLRRRVSPELVALAAGSLAMVGLFTIFPALSIDYGVLRAFQEALILSAPLLVVGSLALFSPFGQRWAKRISATICLGFFISTTGLMPQVLGGYPAQLSLNNSGQYYDIYYVHPQDVAAVSWLAGKPGVIPTGLQAPEGPFTSDPFAFNSLSDVNGRQFVADIYPALIERSSWVLLNYSIVHTDRAPLSSQGELLTYAYPIELLHQYKNLVYNNGSDQIYK